MKPGDAKEQFSRAFCHAIASVAKMNIGSWNVDDESVDMLIGKRGGNGTTKSPYLGLQLKCTSRDVVKEDGIHFQLKSKNYNDLRDPNLHVPRILVILVVPEDPQDWVSYEHCESISLYRHAWWISLRGYPDRGDSSPTIVIPLDNVFCHDSLSAIMDDVGNRVNP